MKRTSSNHIPIIAAVIPCYKVRKLFFGFIRKLLLRYSESILFQSMAELISPAMTEVPVFQVLIKMSGKRSTNSISK